MFALCHDILFFARYVPSVIDEDLAQFLQELGLYKAQTRLPFNAFGTMAMAREVRYLDF